MAFRLHEALGTQNERYFVAATPPAHSLACLRIDDPVTAAAARLATGVGGLAPHRDGFSHPLDDKQSFMMSSHHHSPLTSLAWSHRHQRHSDLGIRTPCSPHPVAGPFKCPDQYPRRIVSSEQPTKRAASETVNRRSISRADSNAVCLTMLVPVSLMTCRPFNRTNQSVFGLPNELDLSTSFRSFGIMNRTTVSLYGCGAQPVNQRVDVAHMEVQLPSHIRSTHPGFPQ